MTIAPRPMFTSAKPWNWAISPPESATMPLDSERPSSFMLSMLMPSARLMAGLLPVARIAEPCSVPKYQYSTLTSTSAMMAPVRMAAGT